MRNLVRLPLSLSIVFFLFSSVVSAENQPTNEQLAKERMAYYIKYEGVTLLPWYYLAAVDQYERNVQAVRNDLPRKKGAISVHFSRSFWAGKLNPNKKTTSMPIIAFFGGKGLDGDKDGEADPNDPDDVLYTMATYLSQYGYAEKDVKKALKRYYKKEPAVRQILTNAKIFKKYQTVELNGHAFPLPLQYDYSYRSTWGDKRGWGGRRMHEGTDLFAGYGVPVRATTYGIIEMKGWNKYGGWRIGIRDVHNVYHYFAHLSSFSKEAAEGKIVKPGTVIGYVGSSGYGKPGTSGLFPPHLHYGMYKYNGRIEWAFDPYPSLTHWERTERQEAANR